jgi:putative ABC transport system permease protein
MRLEDLLRMSSQALTAHRLRSFLTLLGIAVGIAAVILLTSLGQSMHRYVTNEFTKFGTNIIKIAPGRQYARGSTPMLPTTSRPLTLDDADALARLPHIGIISPVVLGNAEIRANGRVRRTNAMGVGPQMHIMYSVGIEAGQFLPPGETHNPRALVVLGAVLKRELFGNADAVGARISIGGERYVVIGVLQEKGQILNIDIDDVAYIPTARALNLYNRNGLEHIKVTYDINVGSAPVLSLIRETLTARHGREDFTVITQEEMIASLLNILSIITLSISALGSISLVVGGVGIITIMTIAVSERSREIGLLVALGARRSTILKLFLAEAVALATFGGLTGLFAGVGLAWLTGLIFPSFPVSIPWAFALGAIAFSAFIGLAAGVLPARHAARLNVVDALRSE